MDPSASSRLKLLALWFGSFKSHLSKTQLECKAQVPCMQGEGEGGEGSSDGISDAPLTHFLGSLFCSKTTQRCVRYSSEPPSIS